MENLIEHLKDKREHFVKGMQEFFKHAKTEADETGEMSKTIVKFLQKKEITKEEEHRFKEQFADILKISGIWLPMCILPGSAVIIPFIVVFAKKFNIDIFPSSFRVDVKLDEEDEIMKSIDDEFN